jgi:hypothetical protein
MDHDFFIAGRWRNKQEVMRITEIVRDAGFRAYCFLENDYSEIFKELGLADDAMEAENTEKLDLQHPLMRAIFEKDMAGQRASERFLLVLPAGIAGHIEAGAAYGMGKKCYAIGTPEKTETLYHIFDEIFQDESSLLKWLEKQADN